MRLSESMSLTRGLRILSLLLVFGLLTSLTGCFDDSSPSVPATKVGKFAVQKIDTSNSSAKRSMSEMNGGTINSSSDSFFILKNVGSADITDIKIYSLYAKSGYTPSDSSPDTDFITEAGEINSTNFETAETAFTVNPGTLNVIEPYSETSTLPLIKISISHGTNANGIGLSDLLPQGENKTYIVITGTSAGVKLQENIEFSTLVNVAKWQVIYDRTSAGITDKVAEHNPAFGYVLPPDATNIRLQNTGTVPIIYGMAAVKNVFFYEIRPVNDFIVPVEIEANGNTGIDLSILFKQTSSYINGDLYTFYINPNGVIYDQTKFVSEASRLKCIPVEITVFSDLTEFLNY